MEELDSKLDSLLESFEKQLERIHKSRSISQGKKINPLITRIITNQDKARELRKKAEELRTALSMSQAQTTVQALALQILPEDPNIVAEFATRQDQYACNDLQYLKEQSRLLATCISTLKPQAKQFKDSTRGAILALGSSVVGIPEKLNVRKQIKKDLDALIQRLSEQNRTDSATLRRCLNPRNREEVTLIGFSVQLVKEASAPHAVEP